MRHDFGQTLNCTAATVRQSTRACPYRILQKPQKLKSHAVCRFQHRQILCDSKFSGRRLMAQASLRLSPPQASTYSEIVPSRTEMLYNPQAISEPVHSSVYPKSSGCIPPPWTTNAFTVRGFHLQRRKFSLHYLRVASRNEFRQNFIKAFR